MKPIQPPTYLPRNFLAGLLALSLLFAFFPSEIKAQSQTMGVRACIDYGLAHNPNMVKSFMDESIAQRDINVALANGLPQIEGSADLQNNFELPVFVLPGENGELQSIPFGLPWQASAGLTLSQLVFDGQFFLGLKAAQTLKDLTQIQSQRNREQVIYDVSRAYYMALVSEERLTQLAANLDRTEQLYDETKALFEEGFAEKIDVDRIEINLNNLRSELEQAQRLVPVSVNLLKFQMGMSMDSTLELSDDLEEFEASTIPEDVESQFNPTQTLEYQVLETQRTIETLNMRRYKVGFLPNLYAFGNYSWNWQWDQNATFDFQIGAAGLQLNIPIFDSFQKSNQIKKYKMEIQKINTDMETLVNQSWLTTRQSLTALHNAQSRLESQEKNKALADKVYNISRIKYTEGVGSSLEVNDAESQLKQAESLYLNSRLEYILAKLDYYKAIRAFQYY